MRSTPVSSTLARATARRTEKVEHDDHGSYYDPRHQKPGCRVKEPVQAITAKHEQGHPKPHPQEEPDVDG